MALLPFSFSAENTLIILNLVFISPFTLSATDAKQHNVKTNVQKKQHIQHNLKKSKKIV